MKKPLSVQTLNHLLQIQSRIHLDSMLYNVDSPQDYSCVRCSGSVGRYIYENNFSKNQLNADTHNKMGYKRFSPSICVTHSCNLSCVYCYQQNRSNQRMSVATAQHVIDWICQNKPVYYKGIEITFIGGEPLLEFNLLTEIYHYSKSKYPGEDIIFYATTNGTILDQEKKDWFFQHKDSFFLRLSIDGQKETHNENRDNSYDKIDVSFFRKCWPSLGAKMTLSKRSIKTLYSDIKHLHELGFKDIGGVNLAEGNYEWDETAIVDILKIQLSQLVDYYTDHPDVRIDQLLDRRIDLCQTSNKQRIKRCGIGEGTIFFDVDGKRYPCTYTTPMTFPPHQISQICGINYSDINNFIDEDCYNKCYLYPICPTCAGANYKKYGSFKQRDKSRCKIQKLVAIFIAELVARKIILGNHTMSPIQLYHTIEAIKHIRGIYYPLFFESTCENKVRL